LIRRNLAAIQSGRVELKRGSVGSLPFVTDSFEKVLTINSMQYWPDTIVGLREIRRVMKSGGMLALRFTPYSGQSKEGLVEPLLPRVSQTRDVLTMRPRAFVYWP
jgi:ubiquinone/menaquinone biosynthesis C-methylase UbiE